MEAQNQIKRTLTQPENVEQIRTFLASDEASSSPRNAVADEICRRFGFFDPLGHPQRSTCLRALRELEARGHFKLPGSARSERKKHTPRGLPEPVPDPQGVPQTAGAVEGVRLLLVKTEGQIRIWNEMMMREHPQGAGPFVGRQLRYLVDSDYGYLGGLGFAACALKLRDRDRWIGWDVERRREQLGAVVGLSRFLIRPSVRCHNLASHVLGLAMAQFPEDFEARYGFRARLVETFVDPEHHAGTCFRAANWERIGQTQGRGRQDQDRAINKTVKDIYVYPLDDSFRDDMGLPATRESALELGEGVDRDEWAQAEFGEAPLGDKRLSRRLVQSAAALAQQPGRAFCGVAQGAWPAVKGYYRFIDKPEESAVTMDSILLPHRERTVRRIRSQKTVLCLQDGTDLDYSGRPECEGLGVTGKNQTGTMSRGLHLHSTMAVTTDGLPLGILLAQCDAPQPSSDQETRPTSSIPIEEKRTFSWIKGLRDCVEIARQAPQTQLISVMDREADFFELFDEQRRSPSVELLVRAKNNRVITDDRRLFDAVRQAPRACRVRIPVARSSARQKKSKQKARDGRAQRTADVSVQYQRVEIRPPPYLRKRGPLSVWVIAATEEHPPHGVAPLQWFLLTTMNITAPADAEDCLRWYCLRWRIEDWHRVLKSGCKIEKLAHRTAGRLRRAIAIHLVIAWRIMLLTLLGREQPDLPAELLFSDLELEVLGAFAKKKA